MFWPYFFYKKVKFAYKSCFFPKKHDLAGVFLFK